MHKGLQGCMVGLDASSTGTSPYADARVPYALYYCTYAGIAGRNDLMMCYGGRCMIYRLTGYLFGIKPESIVLKVEIAHGMAFTYAERVCEMLFAAI